MTGVETCLYLLQCSKITNFVRSYFYKKEKSLPKIALKFRRKFSPSIKKEKNEDLQYRNLRYSFFHYSHL